MGEAFLIENGAVLVVLVFIGACTAATLWLATRQDRGALPPPRAGTSGNAANAVRSNGGIRRHRDATHRAGTAAAGEATRRRPRGTRAAP